MQYSLLFASSILIQKEELSTITVTTDQSAIDHIVEAQILIDLGEYDKSIAYLNLISQRYKGNNKEVEARLLGGLARNHLKMGLNREAVQLWQEAIVVVESSTNDPYLLGVFYNNMSLAFLNLGETDKARKNLLKSLEINPAAQTYQKLSDLVLDTDKDFELSNFYLTSGLTHINDTLVKIRPYFNDTYLKDLNRASIEEGYAYHYFVKGDYESALEKYQEVLSIAEGLKRVSLRVDILKKIGHLYQSIGDSENATEYLTKYISLNDSLRIIQNNTLSVPLQDFIQEKDKETTQEKNQNTGYKIILIAFILVVVFFTLYSYRKRKKNIELIGNSIKAENKSFSTALAPKTENDLLRKLNEFEASNNFLDKNMSFSTLVAYLDSNAKYLRQILKNNKNSDYNNYINELRIRYIVDKLKTDPEYLSYKISYLAEECGFSSHSKFSADFKRVMNVSPSEYISNIKNDRG